MMQAFYQDLQLLAAITVSIFLEAAPFLLLGALVSALFETYVSEERLTRLFPRNPLCAVGVGLFMGMIMPTCECGVVPIARRLMAKGVPPAAAISYMLAAPVINPIVLASTFVAFQYNWGMVLGRAFMVAIPAAVMGLAVGRSRAGDILKPSQNLMNLDALADLEGAGHQCGPGCGHDHPAAGSRPMRVLAHTAREFMEMGRYLIMGCLAAAVVKTFLPSEVLTWFQGNIFLAVAALMALAVLLSICSEADAFVAASFSSFPIAAQLGFVALGPMVDLKLIATFLGVFKGRMTLALILVPTILVYGLALLWSAFLG